MILHDITSVSKEWIFHADSREKATIGKLHDVLKYAESEMMFYGRLHKELVDEWLRMKDRMYNMPYHPEPVLTPDLDEWLRKTAENVEYTKVIAEWDKVHELLETAFYNKNKWVRIYKKAQIALVEI